MSYGIGYGKIEGTSLVEALGADDGAGGGSSNGMSDGYLREFYGYLTRLNHGQGLVWLQNRS